MAKKPTGKRFTITGRLNLEVALDISADSFAEAFTEAQELSVSDFITVEGDLYDSRLKLISVYEQGHNVEQGLDD